jgi:hypothetical protein
MEDEDGTYHPMKLSLTLQSATYHDNTAAVTRNSTTYTNTAKITTSNQQQKEPSSDIGKVM